MEFTKDELEAFKNGVWMIKRSGAQYMNLKEKDYYNELIKKLERLIEEK